MCNLNKILTPQQNWIIIFFAESKFNYVKKMRTATGEIRRGRREL